MEWQTIVVGIIVGLAAFFLARMLYKNLRGTKSGSTCSGCKACDGISANTVDKSVRS